MRLVFASNNGHKLQEVREIMPAGVEVLSLRDIGFAAEIEESGSTLEANSRIKAEAVWEWIMAKSERRKGVDGVFADDTGLEIDALEGKPGVYTARWWSLTATGQKKLPPRPMTEQDVFAANRAKALRELAGQKERGAQFRTVITLIMAKGECLMANVIQVEGIVRGRIADAERGEGGFGYDPLFVPEGYDRTFAELPIETKNKISHRARALAELVNRLAK